CRCLTRPVHRGAPVDGSSLGQRPLHPLPAARAIPSCHPGREVHTARHNDWVTRAIFSPDGRTFATASRDNTAVLWDTRTGERRRTLNHADWVNRIVFNPKGDLLMTASRDD